MCNRHLRGFQHWNKREAGLILVLPLRSTCKRYRQKEWTVTVNEQPSIFQLDTDVEFIAFAQSDVATLSQRKSIKPGDRVALMGEVRVDTISFPCAGYVAYPFQK